MNEKEQRRFQLNVYSYKTVFFWKSLALTYFVVGLHMNYKVINHNNKRSYLTTCFIKFKKVLNVLCNVSFVNMKIVCPKFMAKVLLEITTPKFHYISTQPTTVAFNFQANTFWPFIIIYKGCTSGVQKNN